MKIGIIGGAGLLGSTTAFVLAQKDCVDEIYLVDKRKNLLKSHVMDLSQACFCCRRTQIIEADFQDLRSCDIILMTASSPEKTVADRKGYLTDNVQISEAVCSQVPQLSSSTIWINATNPVDHLNVFQAKILRLPPQNIIGFSLNDTTRLRIQIARTLNVRASSIQIFCAGEHGKDMIPLYEHLLVDGKPVKLNDMQRAEIEREINAWFIDYQSLKSGRTTGWLSAVNLAEMIETIALDRKKIISCSTFVRSNGFSEISIGLPAEIGRSGVVRIAEECISSKEQAMLLHKEEALKGEMENLGLVKGVYL